MRVRALTSVYYAGRDYQAGDEFETQEDVHGKMMAAVKSVELVEAQSDKPQRGHYRRRDMRADK